MEAHKKLLLSNRAWVQEKLSVSPNYFDQFSDNQQPEYLWIGCADSRVPAEEVTGTQPGQLFVHRNIANLVIHTDFNMLAVLQYAVEVLKVKHIIVCGHYGCGGIQNALSHRNLGLINKWLRHIKDVYRFHRAELEALPEGTERLNRMVELNVVEQVRNLAETSIVQQSWHDLGAPVIHGWVYDMKTGYLKEITQMNKDSKLDEIYRYDLD